MSDASVTIGVLTSGGDAQGMNAALRAVVRTALRRGAAVYAIREGYKGMIEGNVTGKRPNIHALTWSDVGGIMQRGGTVIGTARCKEFETEPGQLQAVANLLQYGIDHLVVIGGDGSLRGASALHQAWPHLVQTLADTGVITPAVAAAHPHLRIVGLVGSIDNDFCGTDMTLGADSALHRITEAIDALGSTAASDQRTFVVEVMGRNCGYLALMGALAGSADWVFIPEQPPRPKWQEQLCEVLKAAREAGRRDSIVVIAEGACDLDGNKITREAVKEVLVHGRDENTRVTVLGHVQRGGKPSAFDRWMGSLMGYEAVNTLLADTAPTPCVIGMRHNHLVTLPLLESVDQTRQVDKALAAHAYGQAFAGRNSDFAEMFDIYKRLARPAPKTRPNLERRIAVLTAGAPAPGMNAAVRAAVRLGLLQGYDMLGVHHGFEGLMANKMHTLTWAEVDTWASEGGAHLGTKRVTLNRDDLKADLDMIAATLEDRAIHALLVIGGWTGYQVAYDLFQARAHYPPFRIPIICLPASINNNLPRSQVSIGADTALNKIVSAVDDIKQSAVSGNPCFIVEVMGRYSGYLALMSGLASGAERVYLPEYGISLADLQADLGQLNALLSDAERQVGEADHGQRLSLFIRSENADPMYTTDFIRRLFEHESQGPLTVRQAILGHIQQGGDPSPYDRIQAVRLAARCMDFLHDQLGRGEDEARMIGIENGEVRLAALDQFITRGDQEWQRPSGPPWWEPLKDIATSLAGWPTTPDTPTPPGP